MAITFEAYEDWGAASGARGANRTKITNANLKTFSDPAQNYFLNDVPRPADTLYGNIAICSYTRYISFKVSGTYAKVKNLRIVIPQGFASDNWRVMYGLRSTYTRPAGVLNEFNKMSGVYDGSLITLNSAVTLYPFLSTTGPEAATSRASWYGPNETVWTQYLVLQFMAHPSAFDDVDNFGTETIQVLLDELET